MSNTLWKIKALKNWSEVLKGMEVEIIIQNRTGKPSPKEIGDALAKKYGIKNLGNSGLSDSTFEFKKN